MKGQLQSWFKKGTYILLMFLVFGCSRNQTPKKDSASVTQDSGKPNVILIVTDDQGYGDLGYHGNPWLKTPNLDQFAAQSLELTNFHVGTTCTPTRAGIMTGRNANRNNSWHTIGGCSILSDDELTMAEVFAEGGYRTAMIGKWHLGDNYPYRPQDRGFEMALYHGGGGVGQTPDYWGNDYFDDTYFRLGIPEKFSGYCTDVWFDEAISYIENYGSNPFFLYLTPNAAHGPFNVPESYMKLYEEAPLTERQKRFYGMITNIDDNFGKLVDFLESSGLMDNTILIFTTDNGTALGIARSEKSEHMLGYNAGLRGTKGSHYDGGHKVPFFIHWPQGDILQATVTNELIAHVDLLPTLAELTKIDFDPPKVLDGTSVAQILKGDVDALDRMLAVDTQRQQWPEKNRNSCVMTTEWRLIDGNELYNITNDPGQQENLASEYPHQVTKMKEFYNQWWSGMKEEFEYAYIPVGHETANPVLLTIHDLHSSDPLPWNQNMIREAQNRPNGFHTINVLNGGEYQISLSRYPPESELAINAQVAAVQGTSFYDELPAGIGLDVVKAEIKIGRHSFEIPVDPQYSTAVWTGQLEPGKYQLSGNFFTAQEDRTPAYFHIIEKL